MFSVLYPAVPGLEADRKRIFLFRPKNKKHRKSNFVFGPKNKINKKDPTFSAENEKLKNCYCPKLWNRPNTFSASVALSMMLYKFDCDYDYDLQMSVAT